MTSASIKAMRATKFEFEKRFWIITAIYFVGFSLSAFDETPFIAALRHFLAPSIARGSSESAAFARLVISIGAALVFAAAALRTWAAAYLRTSVVHDTEQHSEALIADGPFRYTRNPLYLASVVMAAGIGVLASRAGFIFLVVANWVFVYRLIFREEEALLQSQSESYRAYLGAVPSFWPSLKARVAANARSPRWRQAFGGESFVWIFGIAELLVALTLRPLTALIAFALGFIAHFTITRWIQK